MSGKHWSDDELVARLYGIKPEDSHIRSCRDCSKRWEAVHRRYESLRPAAIEVPEALLAAQRRAIEARLGKKHRSIRFALVPVMAALLLVIGFVAIRPVSEQPPEAQAVSDSQLFEDIFSRVATTEPSSIGPIRSLFEEPK